MYKLNFLLKQVPPKVIYLFKEGDTQTILARKTGATYSHTSKLIHKFEDNGIIGLEIRGREKIIHLTEKGKELQELFRPIIEL